MRAKHWLLFALLAAVGLLAAPGQARAQDTATIVEDIFTIAHDTVSDSIPDGSTVAPVIQCLADPSITSDSCAASAGVDSDQAGWIMALYTSVSSGDFDGIVEAVYAFAKENAACIVLDALTGGAGGQLCDLAKEVLAVLADVGQAVAEFLVDVGEAVAGAIEDISCAIGWGGCGDQTPADQVAYAWVYSPYVGNGAQELEFGMDGKSCKSAGYDQTLALLRSNASHQPYAILSIQMLGTHDFFSFPGWAVDNAEKMYEGEVGAQWNADMVDPSTGWLWKLKAERVSYLNDLGTLNMYAGAALSNNPDRPGDWIESECVQDFQNKAYGQVDCWTGTAFNVYEQYVPSSDREALQQLRGTTQTNDSWCSNTYMATHGPKELTAYYHNSIGGSLCPEAHGRLVCKSTDDYARCSSIFASVHPELGYQSDCRLAQPTCPIKDGKFVCDQEQYQYCLQWANANQADGAKPTQCTLTPPPCPQYDAAYYCKNMSDYSYCGNWATSVHLSDQNYCQIDTSQLGPQAAQTVKSYLDTLSTANRCTVGGQGRSQAAINQTGMVNGANLRNMAPSIAGHPATSSQTAAGYVPDTSPTVVGCPRVGLVDACRKKAQELQNQLQCLNNKCPVTLVDCEFQPDAAYAKQIAEVVAAVDKLKTQSNDQSVLPSFAIADQDPLVVWARDMNTFNKLRAATANASYFSVPPSSQRSFVPLTSLQVTVDGVPTPTLFFDQAAATGKIIHGAQPGLTTTLQSGTGINVNPITQGQNAGQRTIAPVARVSQGDEHAAISQAIASQGLAQQMAGGTEQVRDTQVRTPRSNFDLLVDAWSKVRPVPDSAPACNCADLLGQIHGLDQSSAALMRQGMQLAKAYDAAGANPAQQAQINKQFTQINPQLYANLGQRAKLYEQFSALQKSNKPPAVVPLPLR